MIIFIFLICFLASVAGAICGIGGGVIIKPVLDAFKVMDVAAISFLSGCTVLSMSCYNVGRNLFSGSSENSLRTDTPLAVGAALGGIAGKYLFSAVRAAASSPDRVGAVQAICLGIITVGTLLYTLMRSRIRTHETKNLFLCLLIGLALGIMSSFLGIGGGPINLIVLSYFFSMPTKKAAQSSLYIILFSQVASLLTSILTRTVPSFEIGTLLCMIAGGIGGGIVGRLLNRKMKESAVDRLFQILMIIIIGICVWNAVQYMA